MSVSDELMWRYFALVLCDDDATVAAARDDVEAGRRHPREVKDELGAPHRGPVPRRSRRARGLAPSSPGSSSRRSCPTDMPEVAGRAGSTSKTAASASSTCWSRPDWRRATARPAGWCSRARCASTTRRSPTRDSFLAPADGAVIRCGKRGFARVKLRERARRDPAITPGSGIASPRSSPTGHGHGAWQTVPPGARTCPRGAMALLPATMPLNPRGGRTRAVAAKRSGECPLRRPGAAGRGRPSVMKLARARPPRFSRAATRSSAPSVRSSGTPDIQRARQVHIVHDHVERPGRVRPGTRRHRPRSISRPWRSSAMYWRARRTTSGSISTPVISRSGEQVAQLPGHRAAAQAQDEDGRG